MQRIGARLLLSATDLVNFHECAHLTAMKSIRAAKKCAIDDESTCLNGQLIVDVDETPAALHPD